MVLQEQAVEQSVPGDRLLADTGAHRFVYAVSASSAELSSILVYGWYWSGGDLLLFSVLGGLIDTLKPSSKRIPWTTSGRSLKPPSLCHFFSAARASWKTKPSKVFRETQFLVRVVRWRRVAKLDSIGWVVLICGQCSAGKS
jgi:hypothetical protein